MQSGAGTLRWTAAGSQSRAAPPSLEKAPAPVVVVVLGEGRKGVHMSAAAVVVAAGSQRRVCGAAALDSASTCCCLGGYK